MDSSRGAHSSRVKGGKRNRVLCGRHARFPRSGEGTLRPLLGTGQPPSSACTAHHRGGPVRQPHPLHLLPRAARAGPWTGDRPPLVARAPFPQPPGPGSAPCRGGGRLPGNPHTKASASVHLRHSCTQGALPTCTLRPLSWKPLQAPRSTHCPLWASMSTRAPQPIWWGWGTQSPVPSPTAPLPPAWRPAGRQGHALSPSL